MKKGFLVMEDGSWFEGSLVGEVEQSQGELVFNTSMVGYEQIITDPSYAGQIVVMTYPLIGNYGVFNQALESNQPSLRGLVVKELCSENGSYHYQQETSLKDYMIRNKLPCLVGVDTRAVTRIIRKHGTMGGVISAFIDKKADLFEQARRVMSEPQPDLVRQVSRKRIEQFGEGPCSVVLMDFGVKNSIITSLVDRGCKVAVVPADSSAEQIMDIKPKGVVLSNGPGDPMECSYAIKAIADIIGKVPVMGICLGHQLMALALGARTYKLKFGHRGGNHPVKELRSGRVFITSQNHGYAVDQSSLESSGARTSFINLNDGTVEGLEYADLRLNSVQFHPEAAPGPQDTRHLFDNFINAIG